MKNLSDVLSICLLDWNRFYALRYGNSICCRRLYYSKSMVLQEEERKLMLLRITHAINFRNNITRNLHSSDNVLVAKIPETTFMQRVRRHLQFTYNDKLRVLASHLYHEMWAKNDIVHTFATFGFEDTFFSWFRVATLYVWLLSVRFGYEGLSGVILRDTLIELLWNDMDVRMKNLGVKSSTRKNDRLFMQAYFQNALVNLDEGLMGSDLELAGAVWRVFYRKEKANTEKLSEELSSPDSELPLSTKLDLLLEPCTLNLHHLEVMVRYIRKQVHIFDQVSLEDFLKSSSAPWANI